LIVEDNAVNREVLRDLLEQADIKVDLAQDGVEALEKLATDPAIGLVLLDLQMPRLSGEGVLAQMRRDSERLRAMPVLVVTANATKDTADRVRRLGADGFVTKPLSSSSDAILSPDVRRLLTDGRRSVAA
jgi:CheY-like chemotaxis protein